MLRPAQFRTLLLALCLSACALLASPPATARAADLQVANEAFVRGDFARAYTILQALTASRPGDPEVDFLLGRSAYQLGDYETAVFAFERVLIARPEADRVRLELGRSYFQLGEFSSARASFEQVLAKDPPPAVRGNIVRYLERLERASRSHLFSGLLSLALSYDDNVRSSPVDERIATVLGEVTLDGAGARPEEDLIAQTTLALNHLYRSHPRRPGWLSGLLLYNASYFDEQDLNLSLVSLKTGPTWSRGIWQARLQGTGNYLTLDGERYLSSGGLELEQNWQFGPTYHLDLSGAWTSLNYAEDARDAQTYRLLLRPSAVWGQTRLSLGMSGELSEADDDQFSYLRYQLRADVERQLPWRLTGKLGYRWQDSDYDGAAPLFGRARHDRLREVSVELQRPLWTRPSGGGRLLAQLRYVATDTLSNIPLYRYDKQVATFGLSYLF